MPHEHDSDGVNEMFAAQLRVGLTAAGHLAERALRDREFTQRQHTALEIQRGHELTARLNTQQAAAIAALRGVHEPVWWERASVADVTAAWEKVTTLPFADAEVRRTREAIISQVRDRYGIDLHRSALENAQIDSTAAAATPTEGTRIAGNAAHVDPTRAAWSDAIATGDPSRLQALLDEKSGSSATVPAVVPSVDRPTWSADLKDGIALRITLDGFVLEPATPDDPATWATSWSWTITDHGHEEFQSEAPFHASICTTPERTLRDLTRRFHDWGHDLRVIDAGTSRFPHRADHSIFPPALADVAKRAAAPDHGDAATDTTFDMKVASIVARNHPMTTERALNTLNRQARAVPHRPRKANEREQQAGVQR